LVTTWLCAPRDQRFPGSPLTPVPSVGTVPSCARFDNKPWSQDLTCSFFFFFPRHYAAFGFSFFCSTGPVGKHLLVMCFLFFPGSFWDPNLMGFCQGPWWPLFPRSFRRSSSDVLFSTAGVRTRAFRPSLFIPQPLKPRFPPPAARSHMFFLGLPLFRTPGTTSLTD